MSDNNEPEELDVYFGGVHGEVVGHGKLYSNVNIGTQIVIDIDHEYDEKIVDLLHYKLVGFAVVVKPVYPRPASMRGNNGDPQVQGNSGNEGQSESTD